MLNNQTWETADFFIFCFVRFCVLLSLERIKLLMTWCSLFIFFTVLLISLTLYQLTWQWLVLLIMSSHTARVWCWANSVLCGCVTLIEKCMPLYAHMHVISCPCVLNFPSIWPTSPSGVFILPCLCKVCVCDGMLSICCRLKSICAHFLLLSCGSGTHRERPGHQCLSLRLGRFPFAAGAGTKEEGDGLV